MSLPEKTISLRQAINDNCKTCIYDAAAAGTWRQQVTLCSVTGCDLYPVRPITKNPIPESTLDYYSISGPEFDRYRLKNTPEGHFSGQTGVFESRTQGQVNGSLVAS